MIGKALRLEQLSLGWEVWWYGMEITQFTYFQKMTGMNLNPISVELTYGLEEFACLFQGKKNVFDIDWNDDGVKYRDVYIYNQKKNFQHIILIMQIRTLY